MHGAHDVHRRALHALRRAAGRPRDLRAQLGERRAGHLPPGQPRRAGGAGGHGADRLQPGGTATIAPTAFIFTYDADEGGWCKLSGLRFQLDVGALDLKSAYKAFLGKPLDITVTVSDQSGNTASDTKHVQIAPQVLCPDGGLSTNC
jgi:hypothetical protein